jgi:hypothetical protein
MKNASLVIINASITQATPLINITLPVTPLGPVTVLNSSGYAIPYYISNNEVIIPMPGPGIITIRYTPYIGILSNGTLQLVVSSNYEVNLQMANDVLPTSIPNNIEGFQKTNSGVTLTLAPGNYVINFITTAQTTQQAINQRSATMIRKPTSSYVLLYYTVLIIVIMVLIIIALMIIRGRR